VRADLHSARAKKVYGIYAQLGTLACLALPVLAAAYAWRTLTPSIEQAMLRLAEKMRGEFLAELDPACEWLDAYWIGGTPAALLANEPLGSRWSVEAVFHDRPVLLSVATSWTDRKATSAMLLLARPRKRPNELGGTEAAKRVAARSWRLVADYPGILLQAEGLSPAELEFEAIGELARAAYELAEER
jgi:hypothetical protein